MDRLSERRADGVFGRVRKGRRYPVRLSVDRNAHRRNPVDPASNNVDTAITHLVQAGVDPVTVKQIGDHKMLATVERYAHANGAHFADAMDMLQKRFKLT